MARRIVLHHLFLNKKKQGQEHRNNIAQAKVSFGLAHSKDGSGPTESASSYLYCDQKLVSKISRSRNLIVGSVNRYKPQAYLGPSFQKHKVTTKKNYSVELIQFYPIVLLKHTTQLCGSQNINARKILEKNHEITIEQRILTTF